MSAVVKSSELAERTREGAGKARRGVRVQAPDPDATRRPRANGVRQAAGNFAVQRLLRAGAAQPKLAVGAPGDVYELEADGAADAVMRMPSVHPSSLTPSPGAVEPGRLQRKCACEEKPGAGGKCEECRERTLGLQRRAASRAGVAGAPRVHEALRSGGQPLDGAARSFLEPRFGQDFSR